MKKQFMVATTVAFTLVLGACASPGTVPPVTVQAVGVISEDVPLPKGYLEPGSLPDSLALLPAPPAAGSAAMAADQEAFLAGRNAAPERMAQASRDADLNWPQMLQAFEPIAGMALSTEATPHTAMLLRRAAADAGLSTGKAKEHYQRVRPFVTNNVQSCTPADEAMLRNDGSYPSGHTAIGWMLALVLTDLMPEKADALMQRGYDFGQSRVVCGVHWMSDTVSGRTIAAATFARIQADPTYRTQRDLARRELARATTR